MAKLMVSESCPTFAEGMNDVTILHGYNALNV